MRTLFRIATLLTVAAAAVLVPAGAAHANVSMTVSLTWPTGAGVGDVNVPASFTAQNLNTAPQQNETLTITLMRLAPSCAAMRSGSNVCPSPDPGVYRLSPAGTGAPGTACAGITFSASAPDASGVVTFTPSTAVVLQPPGAASGTDRCTVNLSVSVTRVPGIDVDPTPGVQTWTNLYVQATSSPSGLQPAVGLSLQATVNRGIPGLSTSASVVSPGTSVSDTATLTGASGGPLPTGTVTFSVFGPNDATCSGAPQTSTTGVSNGTATAAFPAAAAGSYRFTASYSGDTNYQSRLAQCNDPGETVTVTGPAAAPPTIAKTFGAPSVPLNRSTTLTFALSNPNAGSSLSGVGFTDTLPAGLVVATPNALSGSCGGGTITATAGTAGVSLSGAVLAASANCSFSVKVTGTAAGQKNNTTSVVTSVEGGNGAAATATVAVAAPPAITKAFARPSVALGATTTLTFTIVNPAANSVALRGVAFTDSLPAGLVVATPNGLTGTCGAGTVTATAGSGTVRLAGGTLPVGATCAFSVKVTGTAAGLKTNTVTVTSINALTGNTSSANLTVEAPPQITKSFTAASIALGASTTLTFTITNPAANTSRLNGVAFTDTLPAGLVVATPNGLTGTCGAGTITATAGSATVKLTGGTVSVNTTCTFSVTVKATTTGQKNNTVTVTSTNGGAGNTSNASLTVTP